MQRKIYEATFNSHNFYGYSPTERSLLKQGRENKPEAHMNDVRFGFTDSKRTISHPSH